MENEWRDLKIDDLPPDILTGIYDVQFLYDNVGDRWEKSEFNPTGNRIHCLSQIVRFNQKYQYRKSEPIQPSHKEIMSKWWKGEEEWVKVTRYFYTGPPEYAYFLGSGRVSKEWFADRESADIPPEEK